MFSVTFSKIHDFRYYGRTALIGDKKKNLTFVQHDTEYNDS